MGPHTTELLHRVAVRQRLSAVGRSLHACLLTLAGVYLALLLASRLLGIIPDVFEPVTLVTLGAVSLALALALYRRPLPRDSARAVDVHGRTSDLFLTAALIDHAAGDYKPVVLDEAESRAPTVSAGAVVPLRWGPRATRGVAAMAVLLAGILFLPQLDPFGREEARRERLGMREELERSRKATALRIAALEQKGAEADLSRQVADALEGLEKDLRSARPGQKEENLRKLTAARQELGKLWREAKEKALNKAGAAPDLQRFGGEGARKGEEWRKELQEGRADGLRKELAELQELARELASCKDKAECDRLSKELEARLGDLADFAAGSGSREMSEAMQRALDQLAMSGIEGLNSDALAGLCDALELGQMELSQLEQLLQDAQSLECALKALQMAQRLSEMDALDGNQCDGCRCMAEYAALYQKLLAGRCSLCGGECDGDGVCTACGNRRGSGPGMRGPGMGRGGLAGEDDSAVTDFTPERARSAVQAGKILFSLKTQELSDPGEARVEYRERIAEVKQGVSEAILHEQVPPAYHDAIQRYFDGMGGLDADGSDSE